MIDWFNQNIVGIVGILVGAFIAYHVYFLSKKLDFKDRLAHKNAVRKQVEPILGRIAKGISSKSELVNIKKYFKHYPHNNEHNRQGYTYLGAELKTLRFDGVEFFCEISEGFRDSNGIIYLKPAKDRTKTAFNIFVVGIIPYEWIEWVDTHGDEFSYRPQFFTQFRGKKKSPYKYLSYYKESEVYHEESDPRDMKWSQIEVRES